MQTWPAGMFSTACRGIRLSRSAWQARSTSAAWHCGEGEAPPVRIFDPCCGAAYHLSVIAYLHWDSVCRVICSDIDEKAVQLAERNLGLLTPAGMERRSREISAMVRLYDKESHKGALESLTRMQEQVNWLTAVRPIQTHVFRANATEAASLREGLQGAAIDMVFSDIPYGQHSAMGGNQGTQPDLGHAGGAV